MSAVQEALDEVKRDRRARFWAGVIIAADYGFLAVTALAIAVGTDPVPVLLGWIAVSLVDLRRGRK